VRELAYGKVNLCLFLGPVRDDGRHELVTLIESVSLADELEVAVCSGGDDEVVCEGVEGDNLVAAALRALRSAGWGGPPLRVQITKRIPVAAGMGGGSADAAALLRVAARLAPIPGDPLRIAAELGADVPSLLSPGPWLATGAGERLEPRPPLAAHALVVVPSEHRLSTAEVYAEADRLGLPRTADELAATLRELDSSLGVNDLEPAAVSLCPEIVGTLEALRAAGADHALVCGSGPTVAGVWWGEDSGDRVRSITASLGGVAVMPVSSPTSGTIEGQR
jgi:4-diphosphocytidyl-2-C-methyl-D-erythritol kinase